MLTSIIRGARTIISAATDAATTVATAAANIIINPAPIAAPATPAGQPAPVSVPLEMPDPETATTEDVAAYLDAIRTQGMQRLAKARLFKSLGGREERKARSEIGDVRDGDVIAGYVVTLTPGADIVDSKAAAALLRAHGLDVPMKTTEPSLKISKITDQAAAEPVAAPVVQDTLPEPLPKPADPAVVAAAREALPTVDMQVAATLRGLADGVDVLPDPTADPDGFFTAMESALRTTATAHAGIGGSRPITTRARTAIRRAATASGVAAMPTAAAYGASLRSGAWTLDILRETLHAAADTLAPTPVAA
ncbi:hypothetical protein AB0G95_21855 [Streptomyces virginiae]|uniref:hypothetical protein n=1 Tax=Streptomyces virginiae TaxID=1961 RepID=UPI00343AFB57